MTKPEPKLDLTGFTPYIGGEARVPGQENVIKLSANESALGPSPQAITAYHEAVHQLHRYPDGGCDHLRDALAECFNLDPDRLICGNGSDELIALLVRAYAGPGDDVLVSEYGFLYYAVAARAVGARPVKAPETNYTTDVDKLIDAVTPQTRIVFLANPNNPTGSYLPHSEMTRLLAGLPQRVLVVLDAAYAEYVEENDYEAGAEWVHMYDHVVMIRTFSKIFALSALRIGWGYGPPDVMDVLNRLRGPFSVNGPAQAAAVGALKDRNFLEQSITHTRHWRIWLTKELRDIDLTVYPSVANFLLVEFPGGKQCNAAAAADFLKQKGILARKVDNYGLPHCLRFTVGTEAENRRLLAVLSDFRSRWGTVS